MNEAELSDGFDNSFPALSESTSFSSSILVSGGEVCYYDDVESVIKDRHQLKTQDMEACCLMVYENPAILGIPSRMSAFVS